MESDKSYGPIIGLIIIILIIALGSVYFLQKREEAPTPVVETSEMTENDDIETLEVELEATTLENTDEELNTLDTEI